MTTAPRKLQSAARSRALLGRRERVETHPAMALGASVQPFTSAKDRTSIEKNIFIPKLIPPVPCAYCLKSMILRACLITFVKKYLSLIDIEVQN